VIAVLGGLVAACMFATATLCSSRSSRMIGAGPLLSWVMLVGLLITAPIAIAGGVPDELDADALVWLAMSGAGTSSGSCSRIAACASDGWASSRRSSRPKGRSPP
jgi:hypothetical protein